METIKKLYKKYEEIIVYLIVGVLTTIFSWGACWVAKVCGLDSDNEFQNFIINTIGWVAGVLFAYPLNRIWVFHSKNKHIIKEFFGFAGSRLGTWILDIVIMFVFINVWKIFLPICVWSQKVFGFLASWNIDDLHYICLMRDSIFRLRHILLQDKQLHLQYYKFWKKDIQMHY